MFRCHFCAACPPAKTKAIRITVEARARTYPARPEAHPYRREGKLKYQDDPGGTGFEIVREVLACPACATYERRALPELAAVRREAVLDEATRSR
jgi:rubredoxin